MNYRTILKAQPPPSGDFVFEKMIAFEAGHALARRGPTPDLCPPQQRVTAIDWLRGFVMILMALDHVRYFFTNLRFPPEDMHQTFMALFLTRWVTHFCAPLFFMLAGMSAYLSGIRRSRSELAGHLWRRGLWLVVLELTLIGFAWQFRPGYSFGGVIWCLGWSMVILSILVRFPMAVVLAFSAFLIAGHNLLDRVNPASFGSLEWLWHILYVPGPLRFPGGGHYFILFPLVPWVGVMGLGYVLGFLFQKPVIERTRHLAVAGCIATFLFVILRLTNVYGNPATSFMHGGPGHFHRYPTLALTVIAFLNTEKYPPSLQFLLMTLGPSLVVLALLDRRFADRQPSRVARVFVTFGRVPFFYYVSHLYLIHLLALALAIATNQPWDWLGSPGGSAPLGYGWNLGVVWLMWLAVVAILYVPSRWFENLKNRRSERWLRYV